MNTYLTIMVTILVLTQIVRIIQNTIQLRRQYKLFQAQLGQLDDITQEDLDMQRRAYTYKKTLPASLSRYTSEAVMICLRICSSLIFFVSISLPLSTNIIIEKEE